MLKGAMGPQIIVRGMSPQIPDPCELEEWFEDVSHVPHPASALDKGLLARCEEDAVEAKERDDASLFGPVRMVELVFVEPLDSKSPGEVAGALGRIFAQLAVLQLPVERVHTDAGSKFCRSRFVGLWLLRGFCIQPRPHRITMPTAVLRT